MKDKEMNIEILDADAPSPDFKLNWKVYHSARGPAVKDLDGNELVERDSLKVDMEIQTTGLLGEVIKGKVFDYGGGLAIDGGGSIWFLEYSADETDPGWGNGGGVNKRCMKSTK